MSTATINLVPCPRCGRDKTLRPAKPGGRNYWVCLPCEADSARQRRVDNPERSRFWARRAKIKRKYGLTIEEFDALRAAQPDCAICGAPPPEGGARKEQNCHHLDHDHDTGKIREFLCQPCNLRLGWYERNRSAVDEYLDRHSGV